MPSVLSSFGIPPPPNWLMNNQPYAFSTVWNIFWIGGSGTRSLPAVDGMASLVTSVLMSMVILALIAARLRAVALREPRPRREPKLPARPGVFGRLRDVSRRSLRWLPGPSLDGNPVLWREWWHSRQSRFSQVFWLIYASALAIFTAWAFVDFMGGRSSRPSLIPCAAFGTAFGLLAVAVRSASAWSEERAEGRGGLDVLLSTPLSASEIVRGKWWACYRPVIGVAIVPTLVALILAIGAPTLPEELNVIPPPVTPLPLRLIDRVAVVAVVMGQGLLYGAAVVSLGLWLATRFSRPGRAVMLTVVVYGTIALVWPLVEEIFLMRRIDRNLSEGLAAVSPPAAVARHVDADVFSLVRDGPAGYALHRRLARRRRGRGDGSPMVDHSKPGPMDGSDRCRFEPGRERSACSDCNVCGSILRVALRKSRVSLKPE